MRSKLFTAAAAFGVLLGPHSAWAHHSFAAEFDIHQPITIEGALTKMEWVNPHGWIYIDVKKADGTVEHWSVEAAGTNQLVRQGLHKEDFPIGTELVVTGYRARNGTTTVNGQSIKLKDGRSFFMGSAGSPGDVGNGR
jgi:hypothetical protein